MIDKIVHLDHYAGDITLEKTAAALNVSPS